ncbi:MAG: hypothetical protein WC088_06585 [Candidatus Izemoplasmatales bacterium]|jgi:hypothetical protein
MKNNTYCTDEQWEEFFKTLGLEEMKWLGYHSIGRTILVRTFDGYCIATTNSRDI